MLPPPTLSGDATIRSRPRHSSAYTVPTMSMIESSAPTSWRWTFSIGVSCTAASASASCPKIALARLLRRLRERRSVDQHENLRERAMCRMTMPGFVIMGIVERRLFAAHMELGGADSPPDHTLSPDRLAIDREASERAPQIVERQAGVEQRAEDHVTGGSAKSSRNRGGQASIILSQFVKRLRVRASSSAGTTKDHPRPALRLLQVQSK